MKKDHSLELVLDDYSKTPKYKQIVNAISEAIEDGQLLAGTRLPSVNRLLVTHDISRDTIVKAYELLKKNKVIESVPGKGYYVRSGIIEKRARVLLVFNKLSAHKKLIYDAFSEHLGNTASIDFFIYNNDFNLFKRIILDRLENRYSHFVIICHFLEGGGNALDVISKIPPAKLIILDKHIKGLRNNYGSIYQDFENDLYQALTQLKDRLAKYRRLKLIFPKYTYHPRTIIGGFQHFCVEHSFASVIVNDINSADLQVGDAFINLMEDDLVKLIKRTKALGYTVGEQIGIISYNETPIKEILLDGITTISTDFYRLGQTAAEFIRQGKGSHVNNPFYVKVRQSL